MSWSTYTWATSPSLRCEQWQGLGRSKDPSLPRQVPVSSSLLRKYFQMWRSGRFSCDCHTLTAYFSLVGWPFRETDQPTNIFPASRFFPLRVENRQLSLHHTLATASHRLFSFRQSFFRQPEYLDFERQARRNPRRRTSTLARNKACFATAYPTVWRSAKWTASSHRRSREPRVRNNIFRPIASSDPC